MSRADADFTSGRATAEALTLRRVIIIDDSEIDAELLEARLRGEYPALEQVHWINDPAVVMESIARVEPDLVITDHHMPGYDLLATLQAIRERWKTLPVLVISGLVGEEVAIQVLKAGANDFLPKARSERLSMVVNRELAEARAQQVEVGLLRELERQYRVTQGLFDQAPVSLFILSPEGRLEGANRQGHGVLAQLGLRVQREPLALRGRWADSDEIIDAQDWPFAVALRTRREVAPRTVRCERPGGDSLYLSVGAAPLLDQDGGLLGAVCSAADLTHERALQQQLRESERRLRDLSAHQGAMYERQMASVARELHDNLGQVLSLLKLHLGSAARPGIDAARRELELQEGLPLVDLALSRLREACGTLRPSELSDFGLVVSLQALCTAAGRAAGLPVGFEALGGSDAVLPSACQVALFRVAQQALTNAIRHAGARQVQLRLDIQAAQAELQVQDDGCGFDTAAARRPDRHGLVSMRERMELLGGSLELQSQPGAGTTVRAALALPATPGRPV